MKSDLSRKKMRYMSLSLSLSIFALHIFNPCEVPTTRHAPDFMSVCLTTLSRSHSVSISLSFAKTTNARGLIACDSFLALTRAPLLSHSGSRRGNRSSFTRVFFSGSPDTAPCDYTRVYRSLRAALLLQASLHTYMHIRRLNSVFSF